MQAYTFLYFTQLLPVHFFPIGTLMYCFLRSAKKLYHATAVATSTSTASTINTPHRQPALNFNS